MNAPNRRCAGDHGFALYEAVLLMPVALIVLGFIVVCGRMGNIRGDLTSTARDAARAASLQPDITSAQVAADDVAGATLADHTITCRDLNVDVGDAATFHAGGSVTVSIACTVDLSTAVIPGLPGTVTVTETSTELIDRYRAVG